MDVQQKNAQTEAVRQIQEQVKTLVTQEEKDLAAQAAKQKNTGTPALPIWEDPKKIKNCLQRNELGDAEVFKILNRGQLVYVKSKGEWARFNGIHWEYDKWGDAEASVDQVAEIYTAEARRLSKLISEADSKGEDPTSLKNYQKELSARAKAMRTKNRVHNVLFFAHNSKEPLAIDGSEIDQKPWLVPCKNCVINLRTGEGEPGRWGDFLFTALLGEFKPEAECPTWERVILENRAGNEALADFEKRWNGYTLLGNNRLGHFLVRTGRGRNGKTLEVEQRFKVLGPRSASIRPEMLLDRGGMSNPSAPNPDDADLQGKNLVVASESGDGKKFNEPRVKHLSGNDTISARRPYDKYSISFKPTHVLELLTNHLPRASANDFALWERMLVVEYPISYVTREPLANQNEKRADPGLSEKLDDELPGILAWMVRGCLEYQINGLNPPAAVREAVKEYRKDQDFLGDFLEERCIVGPDYTVSAAAVYEEFTNWYEKNVGKRTPSIAWVGRQLSMRFEKRKEPDVHYYGVGLLDDRNRPLFSDKGVC
jgi:putative DNA primase/helicase